MCLYYQPNRKNPYFSGNHPHIWPANSCTYRSILPGIPIFGRPVNYMFFKMRLEGCEMDFIFGMTDDFFLRVACCVQYISRLILYFHVFIGAGWCLSGNTKIAMIFLRRGIISSYVFEQCEKLFAGLCYIRILLGRPFLFDAG